MANILINPPTTYYKERERAQLIADVNNAQDGEGDYRVEPFATGFCIAVYVDGEFMIRL